MEPDDKYLYKLKMVPVTGPDANPKPFSPSTPEQLEFCWAHAGMLHLQKANTCLQKSCATPAPDMLFSEFWREGELCILFADSGLGKSTLAMQIADSISRGEAVPGFKLESKKQPVLYFDFELSAKQFEERYSNNYKNHYVFDDELLRVDVNLLTRRPEDLSFEEYLRESIYMSITRSSSKVIIIDNITWLRNEMRSVAHAMSLMKLLQTMKTNRGLSILVIAHTARNTVGRPVSLQDLQGSREMMTHCDSAFCIGGTNTENQRYLKQVKVHSGAMVFNENNIAVCMIVKPGNFLHFELLHQGMEWEQLNQMPEDARNEMIGRIIKKSKEGKSQRQIALEVGVSVSTVNKYLRLETGV